MIKIERGREVDGPKGDDGGRRHGIWEYRAADPRYPLVCGYSRQPLLDACRQLKSLYGVTGERIHLFREGRNVADISCMVDVGAKYTVKERSVGVIRFEKFEAVDLSVFKQAAE